MSVDEDTFKQLMGRFASGVSILTIQQGERRYGLTVSDFASVSLNPPLVLVNIEEDARSHAPLEDGAGFTVNILRASQQSLALTFAKPGLDMEKRFAKGHFVEGDHGGPHLEDALAWFHCEQVSAHKEGDHTIFIGRVDEGETSDNGEPLLYYEGAFGAFNPD
jgi:flavin reductase (DIM6/NTAB) family NADH-FMN oxidoreductase RutF